MSEDVKAALTGAVSAGIDQAVREHEGGFVNKWVAIIESVDSDGERGLWYITSEGLKHWECAGFLTAALQIEQAETTARMIVDDEE